MPDPIVDDFNFESYFKGVKQPVAVNTTYNKVAVLLNEANDILRRNYIDYIEQRDIELRRLNSIYGEADWDDETLLGDEATRNAFRRYNKSKPTRNSAVRNYNAVVKAIKLLYPQDESLLKELAIAEKFKVIPTDDTTKVCNICETNTKNISIDCGHLYCYTCINKMDKCPTCRLTIDKDKLRVIYYT
jgi:hypothetical protein